MYLQAFNINCLFEIKNVPSGHVDAAKTEFFFAAGISERNPQ
jgi:hypothetical protein